MKSSLDYYEVSNDRSFEIKSLKTLSNLLSELNIKHWIDFGTLLGSIRNQNIIEWDVDLDVSCIIDYTDDWWGQSQINLLWNLQKEFYIKYFWKDKFVSLIPRHNTNDFKLRHIDLYFWKPSDKLYISELLPNMSFRSFFVDELDNCNIGNEQFPCPRHTFEFLKMRYGNCWNIPDKSFCCETNIINNKDTYTCYTSMVGDFFHEGHRNLLKKCKQLFDKVIVGIHNDDDVMTYKNKPYNSYDTRLECIKKSGLADEIYENAPAITTLKLIDDLQADFVVAGKENSIKIQNMYPIPDTRLHLIERTPNISSTDIRNSMSV